MDVGKGFFVEVAESVPPECCVYSCCALLENDQLVLQEWKKLYEITTNTENEEFQPQ